MEESFEKQLENLINRYSRENGSNTPDFILAKYLEDCLLTFNVAVNTRDKWYNFKPLDELGIEATKQGADNEQPTIKTNPRT